MDESLLSPHKSYLSIYKNKHKENASKYFDDLVKKSKINIEENRQTIKEINANKQSLEDTNKKLNSKKSLKTFLIILCIVMPLVWLLVIAINSSSISTYIIPIISIVLIIGLIVYFITLIRKLNKQIKNINDEKIKIEIKIKELEAIAWSQMKALNKLYDWNMAGEIMMQTTPLIKIDKYFDNNKYYELKEKYNFNDDDINKSTIFVQSGSIQGFPFILKKTYNKKIGGKTYTGSIVIHWTTRTRDSNGNTRTVHHSQTLVASIEKPCPYYYYDTSLIYANDAAPNLTFSRLTTDFEKKNDKQIDKLVTKGSKKLNKLSEEAISNNTNFTKLGNDKFEVMFGGIDRNNEVEYRLLFTPLAQTNLIDLIKDPDPFGDDFDFYKKKKINIIHTEHAQKFEYNIDPKVFLSNDYDKAKENFININSKYFEALFFDLAPLLSIPLYQQTKSIDYIYGKSFESNICKYEHETMANKFNIKDLMHPETNSGVILKTNIIQKDGEADQVKINAYSYKTIQRTDIINKLGGDGRVHPIPVHWLEYIPIEKENVMEISSENTTRNSYSETCALDNFKNLMNRYTKNNNYIYQRGLFSMLLKDNINENIMNQVNKEFANNNYKVSKNEIEETIEDIKNIIKEHKGEN